MSPKDIQDLRTLLELPRGALGRFLGVHEITLARWEGSAVSGPRGIHLILLTSLQEACTRGTPQAVAEALKNGAVNHPGRCLLAVLQLAYGPRSRKKRAEVAGPTQPTTATVRQEPPI